MSASVAAAVPPRLDARAALAAILGLALVALLLPVFVTPIPPLWDYPNHLARLYLLAAGADHLPLSDWYSVPWDSWTNVAVDWAAAQLARAVGWMAAGRVVVALAVLLPPLGGVLLWHAVHRRAAAWPLAFVLLAWGTSLIAGFLNFQIGVGLALLAAALDPLLVRRPASVVLGCRITFGLVLIAVHLFGFLFYAALLTGLTLGPRLSGLRARLRLLLPLAVGLIVPALLFAALAPRLPGAEVGAGLSSLRADVVAGWSNLVHSPGPKLLRAGMDVLSYRLPLDVLAIGALVLPLAVSAAARSLQVHAGLGLAGLGLVVLFFLAPDRLGGTYWIDSRFAVMAPFALAAAACPILPPLSARLCATLLLTLALARTSVVNAIWQARQADADAVAAVLQSADRGSLILPVRAVTDVVDLPEGRRVLLGGNSARHLAMLALPLREAFAPMLFAARGKQPVQVRPAMRELAEPEGGDLADIASLHDASSMAAALPVAPYLKFWRRFDYLLVLDADRAFVPADPELAPIADAGFARLYRIAHGPR